MRAFVLACLLASPCQAATIEYQIGTLSGLKQRSGTSIPAAQVQRALNEALENIEGLANLKFIRVTRRPDMVVTVARLSSIGRGVYDPRRKTVYWNSRIEDWSSNHNQQRVIIEHEIGHYLGLGHHQGDPGSIMSIVVGSSAVWRQRHIDWLVRKYGRPQKPDTRPASKALAADMADIAERLLKPRELRRQQEAAVRGNIVRLRQLKQEYGIKP